MLYIYRRNNGQLIKTMKLTRKNKQELLDRISKYLADVSKLVIAGVVLTSIMKEDLNIWVLVGLGVTTSVTILYFSYYAFIKSKK